MDVELALAGERVAPAAPEGVVDDEPGVLVDGERLAIRVDVLVLASLGGPMTEAEVVRRFVGKSDAHMEREIEEHLGRTLPHDWDHGSRDVDLETFRRELRPVDGVVDALDAVSIPNCVASSGTHEKRDLPRLLGQAGAPSATA